MTRCISALSFALLLAVFGIGSALKCYQCNSISDATCADPYKTKNNARHLVDCNQQAALDYNGQTLRFAFPYQLLSSTPGAPKLCHKFIMETGTVIRTCMDGNPMNLNQTCQLFDKLTRAASLVDQDRAKILRACSVCDRDSCNGAGSIVASLPLAALALVASYLYYQH